MMEDSPTRKIIHVDMDAFFAAVEVRENPELKGLPVIVGGKPEERGVVCTCSYEARKFGVRSAMATSKALKLCPSAVLVPPHFDLYTKVTSIIHEVFHEYTDLVEPLSLDEAYLDVTVNKVNSERAYPIARDIKRKIFEKTGLTASAGVSYNKFLAKVASGFQKPDGLTVVTPEDAPGFIARLPIGSFYGVGKVTEARMLKLGIKTGADLKERSLQELTHYFGKSGSWFYGLVRGIDNSPVEPYRERQSFGREITLSQDTLDMALLTSLLEELSAEVFQMLQEEKLTAKTVTLKLKYFNFQQITRSFTLKSGFDSHESIYHEALKLMQKTEAGHKKVRLIGVSASHFGEENHTSPDILELPFPK